MGRLGLVVVVLIVLASGSGQAQTHPCDGAPATSATLTEGILDVGWCHDTKDINGNPTSVTSWVLYSNGARIPLTGVQAGTANNAGLVYYHVPVNFVRGNFTVTVAAINGLGEGPRSSPFALEVRGPNAVPSAPNGVRIS